MYTPRDYQLACTKAVINYLITKPRKHGLVVMPTGSGKSHSIADVIKTVVEKWNVNILLLSHVKEILVQDKEKLTSLLPNLKLGLFSASLSSKTVGKVTIGSVQTIVNNTERFENVKLIIVDEAHLVPEDGLGSYNKIFTAIPDATIIGFTATPFRYKGYLTDDDHIFDDILYEVYTATLIRKGYLSPIRAKATSIKINTSKLKIVAGDYSKKSLATEVDKYHLTKQICDNIIQFKDQRKHWLLFCVSIDHAKHVADYLNSLGIITMAVHSNMKAWERDLVIKLYKAGKLQAIAQVNILSVGFDFPNIDLIGLLRPTKSYVLHVQSAGRGLRIAEGKKDCIILDYAGNFTRLGPIDAMPVFPKKGSKGGIGKPMTKECPECNELVPLAVLRCSCCGYEFPKQEKLTINTKEVAILKEQLTEASTPSAKIYNVTGVFYGKVQKEDKPAALKVTYKVKGLKRFPEWVGIESPYPGLKAKASVWWRKRTNQKMPNTVDEALEHVSDLKLPSKIEVNESGKFPVITRYAFKGEVNGK